MSTLRSIANIWLDIEPSFSPIYETQCSNLEIDFKAKLTKQFPDMQFSEECSCANLPPLDLFIDGLQLGIEVQGPHHFIYQNSLLRTGRTILKIETYKKINIGVIEVPYSDVNNDLDGEKLSWFWDILSKELNAIQPSQSLNPDDDSNHSANESQDESGDDSKEEYETAAENH